MTQDQPQFLNFIQVFQSRYPLQLVRRDDSFSNIPQIFGSVLEASETGSLSGGCWVDSSWQ